MAEHLDDLLALALAHETVVDVHADQLPAHRLDEQCGHDGGVHASGQRQQNLPVADLRADGLHLFFNKCLGELGSCNALHRFGADVRVHFLFLLCSSGGYGFGYSSPPAAERDSSFIIQRQADFFK